MVTARRLPRSKMKEGVSCMMLMQDGVGYSRHGGKDQPIGKGKGVVAS